MKNSLVLGLIAILALVACAAGQPTATRPPDQLRVAFVYIGPVGDGGWSYAHDLGRQYLERELSYVETTFVEAVAEGADAETVLNDLAQAGNDVVFATSFNYMDAVMEVAPDYPETIFLHATGYKTAENVGVYDGRGYQGWYLAGLVAGRMTETDIVGFIAAWPIPEVIRNLNAFTLGVRETNPEAAVHIEWINTWFDPPVEQSATQSLIELGADVIARNSDSTAPEQLAQQRGVYAIGYDSDSRAVAPEAVLTAPIWNWGVYYVQVVQAIHDGTWDNTPYWGSMADGVIELAPFGPMVPADAQQIVAEKRTALVAGTWDVFTGPIYDQMGDLQVSEGKRMSDEALLSFDWLVQGAVGSIPGQ